MQQCCYSASESGGAESGAELNRPLIPFCVTHKQPGHVSAAAIQSNQATGLQQCACIC